MPDTPSFDSDKASRFFDIYLKCMIDSSIPEKQRRWYVKRVEEFIRFQNGHKIKHLSSADIENHFKLIGRQNRLKNWQFYQCIDAIRILYCQFLETPVCQDIDWQYWLEQLEEGHPTTARQLTNEELWASYGWPELLECFRYNAHRADIKQLILIMEIMLLNITLPLVLSGVVNDIKFKAIDL